MLVDEVIEFGESRHGGNCLMTWTPENCTDAVSVVDRLTHVFKKYVSYEYERWEECTLPAYERRVLFSNWV